LIRKYCGWSYTSIFDEYRRFSFPKARAMDQQFIELFDITLVEVDPDNVPKWPELEWL
jgi:tyrosine-protein phosphatase SIW14